MHKGKKAAFIIKLDKVNKQQCSLNEPSVILDAENGNTNTKGSKRN